MALSRLCCGFLASAWIASALCAQSNWVDFVDETGTRLSGPPPLTTGDREEKDFATGDFDQDGDDDLVVVRKTPFSTPGVQPNTLFMNEGGVLTERTAQYLPDFLTADDSRDVAAFDANGDGWLDIVVANTFSDDPRLFLNQGSSGGQFLGWLEDAAWFSPPFFTGAKFCAVGTGDVSGDGHPDVLLVDYDNVLEDRLFINDGTGKFTDETDARLGSFKVSAFGTQGMMIDFNVDGLLDIVKLTTLNNPLELQFLINPGNGFFTQKQNLFFSQTYMFETGDFNRDGRPDLYVVSDNQDYLLLNNSTNADGTVNTTTVNVQNSQRTSTFGGNVHAADADRDGFLDMAVTDVDTDIPGCSRRFALLRNQRPGGSSMEDPNDSLTLGWNLRGTFDCAWMDLNQDGFQDLVMGTCTGISVWTMQPFAAASSYGEGCAGTSGVPAISTSSAPFLGNPSFVISLGNAAPGAFAALLVSVGPPPPSQGPCEFLVNFPLLLLVPTTTSGAGDASFGGSIANDPALEGARALAQWFVVDPLGLGPGGTASTAGIDLHFSANQL